MTSAFIGQTGRIFPEVWLAAGMSGQTRWPVSPAELDHRPERSNDQELINSASLGAQLNTDLDNATSRVLAKLHHEFPTPPEEEFQAWFEPPLNVLDCVLSLNRSYDRFCLPRVEKFRQVHPEITTLASLLELIESYPTPLDFSEKD
jgi:hypothetical protein